MAEDKSTLQDERSSRRPRLATVGALLCGPILASLIVWLPGTNHPFAALLVAVSAGVLSLLIAGALDFVLPVRWRRSRLVCLVPGVAVGVWIGWQFMLTRTVAFECAFRGPISADVQVVDVQGFYARGIPGGAADRWIFLMVDADHDLLDQLLKRVPAKRNTDLEKRWPEAPDRVWRSLFSGLLGVAGDVWQAPPSTDLIEVYEAELGALESTRIFWDGAANRVYALYTLG